MKTQDFVLHHIKPTGTSTHTLEKRMLLLGKSPDCEIRFDSEGINDVAAKMIYEGSFYFIETHGKTRMFLNGKPIKKSQLCPGDRVEICNEILIFDNRELFFNVPENKTGILEGINRFVETISNESDLKKLLDKLLIIIQSLSNGTDIFIFKLDKKGDPQVFVSSCNGKIDNYFSDTVVRKVLAESRGIVIPNALADPVFKNSSSIVDLNLFSVMCAPIKFAGKVTGLVYVGSKKALVSFSERDLDILTMYATVSGMVINHVEYIGQQKSALQKLCGKVNEDGIIAQSYVMKGILDSIDSIACSDITVLLEGETGTGKSRFAELIHKKSNRNSSPFVVVNCSALRGELLESEMFGHKKGSFTGATDDHEGLFATADKGTLFLDEIGEIEFPLQAKLLRTLETGKIRPIGSTKEASIDIRIICATNRDLKEMVQQKIFRADLYYRINQYNIEIPPLRERTEDILLLAYYYLEQMKTQYSSKDIFDFHPDSLRFIQAYQWPGNIRELYNTIHRAVVMAKSPLITLSIPCSTDQIYTDLENATKTFQKNHILRAIELSNGNKEQAAKMLGLSRSTFFRYQAQLGI